MTWDACVHSLCNAQARVICVPVWMCSTLMFDFGGFTLNVVLSIWACHLWDIDAREGSSSC